MFYCKSTHTLFIMATTRVCILCILPRVRINTLIPTIVFALVDLINRQYELVLEYVLGSFGKDGSGRNFVKV